jgi:hypothetical protein
VNRVQLSGVIQKGPDFHADAEVADLVLCCGSSEKVIAVVATKLAVTELRQFQNGDSVSVEGLMIWPKGKPEILAERIRRWINGVRSKKQQLGPEWRQEGHAFKVKLGKVPKRHW